MRTLFRERGGRECCARKLIWFFEECEDRRKVGEFRKRFPMARLSLERALPAWRMHVRVIGCTAASYGGGSAMPTIGGFEARRSTRCECLLTAMARGY